MPDSIIVPLNRGKFALIDEIDADLVSAHKWRARYSCQVWYAITTINTSATGRMPIEMHRLIVGQSTRQSMIDHWNGNGLDNRRSNLRVCSNSQNQQNRIHLTTNTSGFRGVTFNKSCGKWQAAIKYLGQSYHLGVFVAAEEAALAYDAKARQLFGQYARLNFPLAGESHARQEAA